MIRSQKKTHIFFIFLLAASILISSPDMTFAKEIYKGATGSFLVYDRGTNMFKRLAHSDMYLSIKFDLVTEDLKNMVEPSGITTVHVAHYNDTALKTIANTYYPKIYDEYKKAHDAINAKMIEINGKINTIIADSSTGTAGTRTHITQWEKIDHELDEMTAFYDTKRGEFLSKIDEILLEYYNKDEYVKAEEANAKYQIKKGRIIEIGLGCFSMAGSATRIAFGDIGSIVSILNQGKDLIMFCRDSFNRSADDLYDDFYDLDEALSALERSRDESKISSNIARVEKVYNSYLKLLGKFDNATIDNLMNVQQFTEQIDAIETSLDNLKTQKKIEALSVKDYAKIKTELGMLRKNKVQIEEAVTALKEPLIGATTMRIRKNSVVQKKQTELKRLQSISKSGGTRKMKGFGSLMAKSLEHIDNIVSTISQVMDLSLY